jgi:hypothetical protein
MTVNSNSGREGPRPATALTGLVEQMWSVALRQAGLNGAEVRHTAPRQAGDSLFPQVSVIR